MRVLCVAGARPNFMKIKPVIDALQARGAETVLVHTGQHYDSSMSDVFFEELGLQRPNYFLGVGAGTHADQTARVMMAFEPVVADVHPNVVVVVGDVNSTLACALVAAKGGPRVAHVEAGLRSRDWTMPEEVNRVVTDRVSDLLFAPSPDAVANLRAEGYRADQIHLAGNVMVDTLMANLERAREQPILADLGLIAGGYGLVTLHRPANVDDPAVLDALLSALTELAHELPLVFPVHPRTRDKLDELESHPGIRLLGPLGYLDFIALESGAQVVLTDSGGVQEETTALGVACLTLRENTERPITVTQGTNVVVGRRKDRILSEARRLRRSRPPPRRPELWDGRAGERIATVITTVDSCDGRRPTDY